MNYYILILEEKVKAFSLIGSGEKCAVSLMIKGNLSPLNSLAEGDKVVGYVAGTSKMFCYLFDVGLDQQSQQLYLEKTFETKVGASLSTLPTDFQDIINSKEQTESLITITAGQYHQIVSQMMSIASSLENNDAESANDNSASENNSVASIAIGGINKIFYGAPGCGKSRYVSDSLEKAKVPKNNIIRVTFHPEFSNVDFIGQILPTIQKDGDGKDIVKYIFNPGSFSFALLTAYKTSDMVYLIIEEINRGNAAAIFGDMFQLLDRVRDTNRVDYSASEYPVSNPNLQKYLIDELKDHPAIQEKLKNGVYIPSNLTIYATMNSSDQNVFTLDTAFKRRWSFEQISNDINSDEKHKFKTWFIPGTKVTWADFLTKLNDEILKQKIHNQTNEDKRLGKYFVTTDCLTKEYKAIDTVQDEAMAFAYKVLEYVWNDVCKIGREDWFNTEKYRTLEELISAFKSPANGDDPLSVFKNIDF